MRILFARLLARAIIRKGNTSSVEATNYICTRLSNHATYVIKVLEAPIGIRVSVRNLAAMSDSPGQKELVAILIMFENLTPEKKAAFIFAYKGCATLVSQGVMDVALQQNAWQSGHIPPLLPP